MRKFFILLVVLALAGCAGRTSRLEKIEIHGEPWLCIPGTGIKLPVATEFSSVNPEGNLFVFKSSDGSTHAIMAVARHEYAPSVFDEIKASKNLLETTGESYCSMGQPMRLEACSVLANGAILFRCARQFPSSTKSIALFNQPAGGKSRLYAVGYLHVPSDRYSQDLSLVFQRMVESAEPE